MNSRQRTVSRRSFLRIGAGVAGATFLAACKSPTPAPAAPTDAAPAAASELPSVAEPTAAAQATAPSVEAGTSTYKEAPMLAERVAAGELPPVDERLPENPRIVEPFESIGKYGGTLNDVRQPGSDNHILHVMEYTYLVRCTPDFQIIPDVAESFEVNDDATEYTFKLRKGMKWSDGEPYTADDWVFWYEDVYLNEEITPAKDAWLTPLGKPMTLEKVDDLTIKFKFATPNGLFLQNLATPSSRLLYTPKHYLSQFHPKYATEEELAQRIAENNQSDWYSLFELKRNSWRNGDLPCLNPWWPVQTPGENTEKAIGERNPYFFKVDPDGNQLPYIDRAQIHWIEDPQVTTLKILNGEFDLCNGGSDKEKALYIENQEKGKYHLRPQSLTHMNRLILALNLCHKDPAMRELFQNKDFRIGLSYAINRQELIDMVYQGQGEPWQLSPFKSTEFYNEQLAKQYTEYDITKAEEYLDKAGTTKGADGMRVRADGQPVVFSIETFSVAGTDMVNALELIRGYFQTVGVDMQIKMEDRGLYYNRQEANEHDAVAYTGDGGLEVFIDPRWYFPYGLGSQFAIQWAFWRMGDPRGANDEPPEAAKRQIDLYNQIVGTGDAEKQTQLMQEIMQIAADEFWAIGTVLPSEAYFVVANNLHNAPQHRWRLWMMPYPVFTIPEQLYFDPTTG